MTEEAFDYGTMIVVQHGDITGLSSLAEVLDARAHRRPYTIVRTDLGEQLPTDLERVRGVIVLGGYMGVLDAPELPWLAAEIDWIRDTVNAGVPVFGICLGHQLLAHAMGGTVIKRPAPEIGFLPLTRTEAGVEDEIWAGWPDEMPALVIHDDEVSDLPEGAVAMADGTEAFAAYRLADGLSYGVQFHPETSADLFAQWTERPDNGPRFAAVGIDPDEMAAEMKRREPFLRAGGLSLVGRWIDSVVGRDDPMPRRRPRAS